MRAAIVVALVLALSPATATGAPPTVAASATVTSGAAPLEVSFAASGDAASYHWDFGDGTSADGATAAHVYGPGAFTAKLTGTGASGETSSASVRVLSFALTLRSRGVAAYARHLRFTGRLVPALDGKQIALYGSDGTRAARGRTSRNGSFRIGVPVRLPGTYEARFEGAVSNKIAVKIHARLTVGFLGSGLVGRPLSLVVGVRPASAGPARVEVTRRGRLVVAGRYASGATIRLPSSRPAEYRIRMATEPAAGYVRDRLALTKIVFFPRLQVGSKGASVLALNESLNRLHIALASADSSYGLDTRDAVVAFQKLHGLPRTGAVDARFWRVLLTASPPRARYPGDHIEVSKPLQVLFVV